MSPDLELQKPAGEALLEIEKIMRVCTTEHQVDLDVNSGEPIDVQWDYENDDLGRYVSFWLCKGPEDPSPSVRIELGVIDEARRPVAGFHALWRAVGGIGQVQSIVVDGKRCGPEPFLRSLEDFMGTGNMHAVVAQ